MEVQIVVTSWHVVNEKGKVNLAGDYSVMLGDRTISTSQFNKGYPSTEINFPRELIEAVSKLDTEVRESIITSFIK